jgi:ribosomal protein S4
VEVNEHSVTIPSLRLLPGDTVRIKASKRKSALFGNFEKRLQNVALPTWITLDAADYSFTVTTEPMPGEATIGVDIRSVVEFFSR